MGGDDHFGFVFYRLGGPQRRGDVFVEDIFERCALCGVYKVTSTDGIQVSGRNLLPVRRPR